MASIFTAKKILDPLWFKTYTEDIKALAVQLLQFNTDLFILEKIINFEFRLFGYVPGRNTFWRFIADSLYESCIMCAWRIAVDTDSRCLTASKLKKEILNNVTDEDARKHLKRELERVAFNRKCREVTEIIKEMRHKRYAHLNKLTARAMAGGGNFPSVPLRDLRMVRDTLNEFIQIMGFEANYMFLPRDYDPSLKRPLDVDDRPDIVRLLDDMAFKSEILHFPEKQPELWSQLRNRYSKPLINKINMYRKKFGLPEA
jgi:hypothetical protein